MCWGPRICCCASCRRKRPARQKNRVKALSSAGKRVVLLARHAGPMEGDTLSGTLEPLALIPLGNPLRATAAQTFAYFAEQGVQVKVISGDSPDTVSQVAAQAGIPGVERAVNASLLAGPQELEQAARDCTVFGRVTPEQKRELVRALKKAGHTVAMTGDGVNDVLALKEADCGIAMASGSDAASQVAQVVLLDSDFAALPQVVGEGRRVINNIERAASLFLVKTVFSLLSCPGYADRGIALSCAAAAAFPHQRPDHRCSGLLSGAGAQPQPGQRPVFAQGFEPGPSRRTDRSYFAAGPSGIRSCVWVHGRGAFHDVRHPVGGGWPAGAVSGMQALQLETGRDLDRYDSGYGGLYPGLWGIFPDVPFCQRRPH